MRIITLAVAAALIGTAFSVRAGDTPESDRSLRDVLPLFETNRCAGVKDTAGQLFCGDPDLRSAGARLNVAVEGRLGRIAGLQVAIVKGSTPYIISATAPAEQYDQYSATFNQMVGSFRFS